MTDYSDKKWLREDEPFVVRLMDMAARAAVVFLVVLVLAWIVAANEARAGSHKQYCPRGSICALLPNSMHYATADECQAAYPGLGRPYFTAARRDRSNEPYHSRTCYWKGQPA